VPYQPLQRTIWPLVFRSSCARPQSRCFLHDTVSLCDPESRIPAFHGRPRTTACLCPRQLVPVAACIESAPDFLERGPPRQTSAPYRTSTKLRASVAHASSSPPHPSTGRAQRRTTPRAGLKFLERCSSLAGCLFARCVRMLRRHGSPLVITSVSAFLVPRQGRSEPRLAR
jgi:hypothetical protein